MKVRFLLRLINAYTNRFKGIILAGIFLGVLSFFTFKLLIPIFYIEREVIGVTGRYHTDNLPNQILSLIGDGLTKTDNLGIVEPSISKSWETPDKGKTWIFYVNDNIFWQDQTPVTSDSIVYEFSDVEIEKPDQKTLIFKLKNPYAPFPSVISKPTFRKGLLGTGEWEVKNIIISGNYVQKLTLTNDNNQQKIYKFYPTDERTKLAFKLGHVNKILNILDPQPFSEWKTASISYQDNTKQVITLFFDTTNSALSNKSLRQALAYAINKQDMSYERALGPISPSSWAYNPQIKKYEYDRQRALELIDEIPDQLKNEININLVSTPSLLTVAENISNDWRDIGIKSNVLVSSIVPEKFQAYLTIYDIPSDPDQYPMWHSTQESTNISGYANPRIDKLLEDGRVTLDTSERRKIYLDFQRFLLEDIPSIFLFHPRYYTIGRKS